jgi:uncharacterized protein (DUF1810 family)
MTFGSAVVESQRSNMTASDPYNLQRFIEAQDRCYERVCQELSEGYKQSHWMWFIFPQLKGLGYSAIANHYGISSLQEAEAYLQHPILGPRLRHCTDLVVRTEGRSVEQIFGDPDDLKFRSCMTLFASTAGDTAIFKDALHKFFAGKPDQLTLRRL